MGVGYFTTQEIKHKVSRNLRDLKIRHLNVYNRFYLFTNNRLYLYQIDFERMSRDIMIIQRKECNVVF